MSADESIYIDGEPIKWHPDAKAVYEAAKARAAKRAESDGRCHCPETIRDCCDRQSDR